MELRAPKGGTLPFAFNKTKTKLSETPGYLDRNWEFLVRRVGIAFGSTRVGWLAVLIFLTLFTFDRLNPVLRNSLNFLL